MANALDAVLQLRANEQARQQNEAQAISHAIDLFTQARQNAQANQLKVQELGQQKQLQDAQISNLVSEAKARQGQEMLANLIKGSQLKKTGQDTKDKSIYDAGEIMIKSSLGLPASVNQFMGEFGKITPPISLNPSQPGTDNIMSLQQQATETDWTGSPTPAALEAKRQLELQTVKDRKAAEQAARTPEEKQTAELNLKKLQMDTTPEGKAQKLQDELATETQKEIIKGPAEGAVGKIALAKESLKNIDDIEKILFPNGKFDRGIAARGNMPGIVLPFLGKVTPRIAPDNPLDNNPSENSRAQAGQDYGRKIGASLAARQLIQTGVAARPEETQALYQQFAPNLFSNAKSAKAALDELRDFYKNYLKTALPEERLKKDTVGKVGKYTRIE